jgi:hypothetical protein
MLTSTHATFQQYGIPLGLIDGGYAPVYIAQDAFTRQHHTVTAREFVALGTGEWRRDEVMSMAYTGSIAMIDPPTQTVTHHFDDDLTTPREIANLDTLVVEHLMRMTEPWITPPK